MEKAKKAFLQKHLKILEQVLNKALSPSHLTASRKVNIKNGLWMGLGESGSDGKDLPQVGPLLAWVVLTQTLSSLDLGLGASAAACRIF